MAEFGDPEAGPGLRVVSKEQLSSRLHEVVLRSSLLLGETTVRVLLPDGHGDSTRSYPVLYLYHGGMGDHTEWTSPEKGDAEGATEGLDLIVVMPDNGPLDYSADWYNEGRFGNPQWERYTFAQLLPWVDATFPTAAGRSARAAAGVSLGGYAALSYVARRPDRYSAVACFSGQIDTNNPTMQELVAPFAPNINGSFDAQEVRWRGNNPWDLAANLEGVDITLFCGSGTGEPSIVEGHTLPDLEAMVHRDSVNVAERLAALGIPHRFDDYGRGSHDWEYFQRDLVAWLPQLMEHFSAPALAPAPEAAASFAYCCIKPDYTVYGWRVSIERPAPEFSALRVHGDGRAEVIGSGRATVATAPAYEPGRSYVVAADDADGHRDEPVTADREGRLRVALQLGPGNPEQQYTPAAAAAALEPAKGALAVEDLPFHVDGAGSRFFRAAVRVLSE